MLVQIPALAVAGYYLGKAMKPYWPSWLQGWNYGGVPGMVLVFFVVTFWMFPRSVDAALNYTSVELFKLLGMPLLVGLPLAFSWGKLNFIGRSFIWANLISMLFVMGWLYLAAPVRLCNNYLVNQQVVFGKTELIITVGICLLWGGRAFFPAKSNEVTNHEEGA